MELSSQDSIRAVVAALGISVGLPAPAKPAVALTFTMIVDLIDRSPRVLSMLSMWDFTLRASDFRRVERRNRIYPYKISRMTMV